jgi:hypothetical protein
MLTMLTMWLCRNASCSGSASGEVGSVGNSFFLVSVVVRRNTSNFHKLHNPIQIKSRCESLLLLPIPAHSPKDTRNLHKVAHRMHRIHVRDHVSHSGLLY